MAVGNAKHNANLNDITSNWLIFVRVDKISVGCFLG